MIRADMYPWDAWRYGGPSPCAHEWVEIERPEWPGPRIVRYRDLDPMFNVHGLQWRPVVEGSQS